MYHNTQHDGEARNKKLNNMFIYLFIYLAYLSLEGHKFISYFNYCHV